MFSVLINKKKTAKANYDFDIYANAFNEWFFLILIILKTKKNLKNLKTKIFKNLTQYKKKERKKKTWQISNRSINEIYLPSLQTSFNWNISENKISCK